MISDLTKVQIGGLEAGLLVAAGETEEQAIAT